MDLCYGEQFLHSFMPPYPYYLTYLPAIPVQNYEHSTFCPIPYQESLFSQYPHPFAVDPWTMHSVHQQKHHLSLSAPQKNESGKGAVIQQFQKIKKEEDRSKAIQKESRNVLSNLLRIFFKNVLEVRMYDHLINKIIDLHSYETTPEDFYRWLEGFGINYKNYIRFCSVKKIMSSKKRKDHLAIFRVLLREFIKTSAITHCLTSKRIDRASMEMHLQGLLQLKKDLLYA